MATLRIASTLILVRDGVGGLEVFLMKRHLRSDFVGGAYVFPGGVVDAADEMDESLCSGRDDASASAALGMARGGLAYWVAGIRECFEEAGILLAYDSAGRMLSFDETGAERRYKRHRRALNSGALSFPEVLSREGLRLATDRVHYWGHWITPEGQPRRYDTRFFLAVAPARQAAAHDGRELTDSAWVRPQLALEKAKARAWTIIFPTVRNLMLLCEYPAAADAEAAARRPRVIPAVTPRVLKDERGARFVIPGDEGYEMAAASVTEASGATNFIGPGENGE